MKTFNLIILFLLLAVSVSAQQIVYDDFSGSVLDTNKWNIASDMSGVGANLPSEYGIDTLNKNFHTVQTEQAEKGIMLSLTRQLLPSETLEYDIIYNSGTGNHLSRIFINNQPFRPDDDFAIGYWNEPYPTRSNWNNLLGQTIHTSIEFSDNSATATFTNQLGQNYIRTLNNLVPPYNISVNSRTGHDGMFHFDYDNFVINDLTTQEENPPEECEPQVNFTNKCNDEILLLKEDINELNSRVDYLEKELYKNILEINKLKNETNNMKLSNQAVFTTINNRISQLESRLDNAIKILETRIKKLEKTVSDLIIKLRPYLV